MYGEDREDQVRGRRTPREESARGTRRARPWPHRCGRGWRRGATCQEAIMKHWGIGPECCEQSEHVRRQHSTKDVTKKTTDHN